MFPADLQYWECQTGGLFRRTGRYNESLVILGRPPGVGQTITKSSWENFYERNLDCRGRVKASRNADCQKCLAIDKT